MKGLGFCLGGARVGWSGVVSLHRGSLAEHAELLGLLLHSCSLRGCAGTLRRRAEVYVCILLNLSS